MVSWTFSELNSRILFFFDQLQRKGCALEWPESAKKVEKVIQKIFDSDFISTPSEAIKYFVFLWIGKYLFVAPLSGSGIHLDWLGLAVPSKSQTSYFPPFAFYFLEAKTLSFLAARFCRSFLCCGNLLLFLFTKFALVDDTFYSLLNFACYSIALLFSKSGEEYMMLDLIHFLVAERKVGYATES